MDHKDINLRYRLLTAQFRSLPDFIIIGAQKGGTSSLFSYLKQHPELHLSVIKEIHFFDNHCSKGINWYRSHFPLKRFVKKIKTGEASPYYMFHPLVAKRVYDHCPLVKLIVMLRNPADRAYSHYMMQNKRKVDPVPTFEEAIAIENKRLSHEIDKIINEPGYISINHQKFSYLNRGMYYQQLSEWFKYFYLGQFLFIKSEEFFKNPSNELLKVYEFLGLRKELPANFDPENVNYYPPMNEKTRRTLNAYFAKENKKLSQILGDKFLWEE